MHQDGCFDAVRWRVVLGNIYRVDDSSRLKYRNQLSSKSSF
jgi:hypothetical protein